MTSMDSFMQRPNQKNLPPEKESDLLRAILALLALYKIPAFRSNAGGGFRLGKGGKPQLVVGAPAGWPDITGWLPNNGRILLIEVKRPGERPTPAQYQTLNAANADGGVAFWTDDFAHCHTTLIAVKTGLSVRLDEDGNLIFFSKEIDE